MRKREDQLITTPEATDTSRAWVYTSFSALLILHPHQHGSMTVTSLRADDEVLVMLKCLHVSLQGWRSG